MGLPALSLPRFRVGGGVAFSLVAGGGGGSFLDAYKLPDGTLPSAVLDFVNGIYYLGTTPSTIGAMLTGSPTTDANGLIPTGDNTIQAQTALQAAFTGSGAGVTVAGVTDKGNQQTYGFPLTMGGNAYMYYGAADSPQRAAAYSATLDSRLVFAPSDFTGANFFASGYHTVSPKKTAQFNDQTAQQDDNNYDTDHPIYFGWWTVATFPFTGRVRRVAVWPKRLTAVQLSQIRALAPFAAKNRPGLFVPDNSYVTLATGALKYERTQPWSCVANFSVAVPDTTNGQVLFSNVIGTPWCGYEIWIQGTNLGTRPAGRVCVRIMQDLDGDAGSPSAIDVYSSIGVADGATHTIGVPNAALISKASDVRIWIDGVEDTSLTVAQDNLAGSIIGNAGQMYVGNQNPGTKFGGLLINFLAISAIARSPAYMVAHGSYDTRPAVDSDTSLYFDFTEGTGATLTDKSASGFNGTVTGSTWY